MSIQELPPKQAHDLRESDPKIVHIDVRSPEEFAAGHPAGSINVPIFFKAGGGMQPNTDFLRVVEKVAPDKRSRVILSCAVGGRSMRACALMEQSGWTQLVNVAGGFSGAREFDGTLVEAGWADAGLPVSKEPGERAWSAVKARA
jgi:rhodanese-related sulfurtransferase